MFFGLFCVYTEQEIGRDSILCVECKWDDRDIDPSLSYLKNKFLNIEAYQISAVGKKDYESTNGIRVLPALVFLQRFV